MPIYEYQCQECAEVHEMMQRVSEPPFTICPRCGGALKKLISAPAIQFKGSGFYITDYARSGSKSESSADGGKKESSASGEKKSESKTPPAKSE